MNWIRIIGISMLVCWWWFIADKLKIRYWKRIGLFFLFFVGFAVVTMTTIKEFQEELPNTNTIDSLVAVKVDSIIKSRYGVFLKTQQDESILESNLQYLNYIVYKEHPRYRIKLNDYRDYWEWGGER